MTLKRCMWLALGLAISAGFAGASSITYHCDPANQSICTYLNSTVALLYNNTFIDANASVYVTVGSLSSDVSESEYAWNYIGYSTYVSALTGNASDAVQTAALDSVNQYATPVYGNGDVAVTGALAEALGIQGQVYGVTAGDTLCLLGAIGCYSGDIVLSSADFNSSGSLGGYSLATQVEHETDEVLGTGSCTSQYNSSECPDNGTNDPSAVDLFRYSAPGSLIPENDIVGTANAYFSFDGGATNPAGVYYDSQYGYDYGDFAGSCQYVQDGSACGTPLNITTDGAGGTPGPEITILNAIGYDTVASAPEPGTMGLFGAALAVLAVCKRRRV